MVGITHVLNTAQGNKFAMVDTGADYYQDVGIRYLGLKLLDIPSANIAQFFEDGAHFIEEALSAGGKGDIITFYSYQHHHDKGNLLLGDASSVMGST